MRAQHETAALALSSAWAWLGAGLRALRVAGRYYVPALSGHPLAMHSAAGDPEDDTSGSRASAPFADKKPLPLYYEFEMAFYA